MDKLKPIFPFSLLYKNSIFIENGIIFYKQNKKPSEISPAIINRLRSENTFFIFKKLIMETDSEKIILNFLTEKKIESFLIKIVSLIDAAIRKNIKEKRDKLDKDIETLFEDKDKYIARTDLGYLMHKYSALRGYCKSVLNEKTAKYLSADTLKKLKETADFSFKTVDEWNEKYIEKDQRKYKDFFVNGKGRSLTDEQTKAIITLEDRNLLIAAAGSGKTETLLQKLKYLIEKNIYEPEEIITLSFNKNVRKELIERARTNGININEENIHTFHSLGYKVIEKAEGQKPNVANENFADRYIDQISTGNQRFWNAYLEFVTHYIHDFKDRRDPYEEYADAIQNKRRKSGFTGKGDRYKTIKGETVKSYQEAVIANFLYINGVNYIYEKPFYSKNGRYILANPDFYYPDIKLYHEHYAVDENGVSVFGGEYVENMFKKRNMYREQKVKCIETTSGMFYSGKLLSYLEKELLKRGCEFNRKSIAEINKDLGRIRENKLKELIKNFLANVKNKNLNLKDLKLKAEVEKDRYKRERNLSFLKLFSIFYEYYEKELKDKNLMDYDDMLIKGAEYIEKGIHIPQCEFIAVDEFQDISFSKIRLVDALLKKNPKAKLFAVGDDYQAINGFSGADVKYVYDFEKYFKTDEYGVKTDFLSKTFRCNKGITEYSSNFIQKNPKQIKKEIIPTENKTAPYDTITIVNYENGEQDMFSGILDDLKNFSGKKIFILNRNHNYYNKIEQYSYNLNRIIKNIESKGNKVIADTIHGAKGLESDIVCIIHAEEGVLPSLTKNDSIMDLVSDTINEIPFAEERRLFYVALTRAKEKVFIYADKESKSSFLSEEDA